MHFFRTRLTALRLDHFCKFTVSTQCFRDFFWRTMHGIQTKTDSNELWEYFLCTTRVARTPLGVRFFVHSHTRTFSYVGMLFPLLGPGEKPTCKFKSDLLFVDLRFRRTDFPHQFRLRRCDPLSFPGTIPFTDPKPWISSMASSSESWANVTQQIYTPFTTHRNVP